MPITMDEAALAWARLLLRAESAESRVKELEGELAKLKETKPDVA